MGIIKKLKIGQRISLLTSVLLVFVIIIGGIGSYKMMRIGEQLEDLSSKDMPMTILLTKITEYQLEQEILFEKILRLHGVTSHAENESSDIIIKKFKTKAGLFDKKIKTAELLAKEAIIKTKDQKTKNEFEHILDELKKVEEAHKLYDDNVYKIIEQLQNNPQYQIAKQKKITKFDKQVIGTEHEGELVAKEVEAILSDIETFTAVALDQALSDEKRGLTLIASMSVIILLLGCIFGLILARGITKPVKGMTSAMNELAHKNLEVDIPYSSFEDEIYDMSNSMVVFRDSMRRTKELEIDQKKTEEKHRKRQDELNQLVGIFGATIGAVFDKILSSSQQMVDNSNEMGSKSSLNQKMASDASDEAIKATQSTQTLSAAAEEMSAPIEEISKRVNQTTTVVSDAASNAQSSKGDFESLEKTASDMALLLQNISDVSTQINLLALNATIESARAGEAGKGFAVVANEVKNLANETEKLTGEISNMIDEMQSACRKSSESIEGISNSVTNVNEYVSSIAAAIEEQSAATKEISEVAQSVYLNSEGVTKNVNEITLKSSQVEESSSKVKQVADDMKAEANVLSKEIKTFLKAMQGTDVNDNTYEAFKMHLDASIASINWNGETSEISCAHIVVTPVIDLEPSSQVQISIDNMLNLEVRVAKHQDDYTYLQLPLDHDHLLGMKTQLGKLSILE